jgi:hypothetical protein
VAAGEFKAGGTWGHRRWQVSVCIMTRLATTHPKQDGGPQRHRPESPNRHRSSLVRSAGRRIVGVLETRAAHRCRAFCVRRLPPDPQGDRTRISWDPWSIRTSSETLHPKLSHSSRDHLYPSDETYRLGECASGWIPFRTGSTVLKVRYANGVDNAAIWDATNLDKKLQISSG